VRISMRGICKRFAGTVALEDVGIEFRPGEIHGILGENGAGKTTLMNALYGLHQPDRGEITIDDEPVSISSPRVAISLGIGMIHQHYTLAPALTIAENIILGEARADGWWLKPRSFSDEIRTFARHAGYDVDPDRIVRELSVSKQQQVEIIKALRHGGRALILDEPTAVLSPQETVGLFTALRHLSDGGRSIVFISHKLQEMLDLCDRVTVLRRGRVVATVKTTDTSADALTGMMIGGSLKEMRRKTDERSNRIVVSVNALNVDDDRGQGAVTNVSLDITAGEILGLAGVDGNGQKELAEALTGQRPSVSGTVSLDGRDVTSLSVRHRLKLGMGHIPQDRHESGLILDFSIQENLILNEETLKSFSRFGLQDLPRIRKNAERLIDTFDIRTDNPASPAGSLSGGNQQKTIFARELDRNPRFLIAFNPTRGVDVSAARSIYECLLALRESGAAILLISTELDEILAVSDRIAVICGGLIAGTVPADTSRLKIGSLMTGSHAAK
jgi:general nucleoside transport system ATP-binding protein